MASVILYLTVHIPSLRTFSTSAYLLGPASPVAEPQSSHATRSGHACRAAPVYHPVALTFQSLTQFFLCCLLVPHTGELQGRWNFLPSSPPPEVPFTASEKSDAVRVLAAGNALVALCLVGVICMQAGQAYAKRTEEREQRMMDEKAEREAERIKKDI
jgi:hypothetical protein